MPLTASDLVLVSGANGFLGTHIVAALLATGARVRGTVRSESSAAPLRLHEPFASAIKSGQLEIALVPDITVDGAFDEALKGTTYIVHSASPLAGNTALTDARKDFYDPAVQGTTSLLRSAAASNARGASAVQHVALTSSIAAISDRSKHHTRTPITGEDWNPIDWPTALSFGHQLVDATQRVEAGDVSAQATVAQLTMPVYSASKTLAEREAWSTLSSLTASSNGGKPPFSLTALNPVFLFGPALLPSHWSSGTNGMLYMHATTRPLPASLGHLGWVDVRDAAAAHVAALNHHEAAAGKRFLVSAYQPGNDDIAQTARDVLGEQEKGAEADQLVPPLGDGEEKEDRSKWNISDGSAVETTLGVKYREWEQASRDYWSGLRDARRQQQQHQQQHI